MPDNSANKIDTIASNIMELAFHRGGTFNRCPIGYGYEELSDKERYLVLKIIEKYGEPKGCLPYCWIFDRYELIEKGKLLHEEYGNYLKYLEHKEQERQDAELDRKLKQISIITAEETVRLAKEANNYSNEALYISKEGNEIADNANQLSKWAIVLSIVSIITSIICAFKDSICHFFVSQAH